MHVKTVPASYSLKADDSSAGGWEIEGWVSLFDAAPDSYGDVVKKNAFSKALENQRGTGRPRFFMDHHSPLGRILSLEETDEGLKVRARISKTSIGHDARILLEDDAIGELSYGYDLSSTKGENRTNEHGGVDITEIGTLYEVSLVSLASLPEAVVTGVKHVELDNREAIANIRAELASLKASALKDGDSESIKPNEGAAAAGKRAQDWIAEGYGGEGLTDTGKQRAAQMAKREPLSLDTWAKVHAYFSRHASDANAEGFNQGEDGYPSPGRVAWECWGGDAGRKQAASIVSEADSDKGASMDSKAASGSTDLPIASSDTSWDGDAAEQAVAKWATNDDGNLDMSQFAKAFFWKAENAESQKDCKLGFATVSDGELKAVPAGVKAAAGAVQGARGNPPDIPESDVSGVKAKIATYYNRMDLGSPPWVDDDGSGQSSDDGKAAEDTDDGAEGQSDTAKQAAALRQMAKDLEDMADVIEGERQGEENTGEEPNEPPRESSADSNDSTEKALADFKTGIKSVDPEAA